MRVAVGTVLIAIGGTLGAVAQETGSLRAVEAIYVVRSLRLSRITPTSYCQSEQVGFSGSDAEDRYSMYSTEVRKADGRMVNAKASVVGSLHACYAPMADSLTRHFYAEGQLNGVPFIGRGECRTVEQDYPEPGLTVSRCFLELSGLPKEYVGGQLTTNSVVSRRAIGDQTDPPGYVQPSIATVRLWKKR